MRHGRGARTRCPTSPPRRSRRPSTPVVSPRTPSTCSGRSPGGTPFPLDDFQVAAILAILEGSSVIVSAPTGAGKTLVAEFAIHDALAAKRRVAYTTPLKALSNQKYADFCRQFGVDRGRHPDRRRQGQPARARAGDDHRDPPEHVLHGDPGGPPPRRARRVPLHGRRGPRHGLGGDHRQRAEGRDAGGAVGHRGQRATRSPTGSALVHRPILADRPPAPAGAAPVPRGRPGGRDPPAGRRAGAAARKLVGDRARGGDERRGRLYARRVAVDPTAMLEELESARLAARDLLHLQPRRVRAGDGRRPRGGPAAPRPRAAAARWTGDRATPSRTARRSPPPPLNQSIFQALRAWASGSTTRGSCRA